MIQRTATDAMLCSGQAFSERAALILDTAEQLLLRWGYARITMEEIAERAGIGTGTLYLHWKSKVALFETVLLRELLALWSRIEQELQSDPQTALLHRFLGAMLRAIHERPLARALFVRDATLLGNLARTPLVRQNQAQARAVEMIVICRELGLMRSDSDADVQGYAFSAVWTGFVLAETVLAEGDRATLDTQIAALAETVRRTFEPPEPPAPEALRELVAPALAAFLAQARQAIAQQIAERLRGPG